MIGRRPVVPWWMTAIIIVAMLPATAFPVLLNNCPADNPTARTLVWCYPFYVLLTGALCYITWPERPWLTWILLIIMALTHAAMWLMITA